MKIIDELNKLSTQIEESKRSVSQLEGQKIELLKRAKEFGFSTIEEGEKIIAKLTKEKDAREAEIEKDYKSLRENYEW